MLIGRFAAAAAMTGEDVGCARLFEEKITGRFCAQSAR